MYSKLWNCNRLWKIWYAFLVILLQIYVTYNSIRNYILFKSQYYDPRYGGTWNIGPLHLYIACIIISISLVGFFIYFCLINIRTQTITDVRSFLNVKNQKMNDCYGPIPRIVSKLMQEKLPYAPLLHLLMAVFLMIPLPVVQMEQIRNEALSPDSIWIANFDFFSDHFTWPMSTSLPKGHLLDNLHYVTRTTVPSLEFINFSIASLLFLIKLPNVLWYSHKWFSVLFSIIIFVHCFTWLIIYEAGSIFIKCSGNKDSVDVSWKMDNQIQYPTMLCFVVIHFLLSFCGFIAVFDYGQTQSAISWLRGFKTYGCFNNNNLRKNFWVFSVITVGFTLLLITLIVDSLIFVTFFQCFQNFHKPIFLVAIIFGIVIIVLQFLVWFTFSIKNRWAFQLDLPGVIPGATRINDHGNKYGGSPDTIYGCFHNNITLSTSSSHSSGRGTGRPIESSNGDNGCYGSNYQNYVYLQSPTAQIPTISEDYDENNTNTSKSSSINMIDNRNTDHDGYRAPTSISDNGINKINENLISDSYRSLQMMNCRKTGKLVTFHDSSEEKIPFFNTYDKGYSNSNMDKLDFLKVPDILNLNRSTLSRSLSESSLDQISSSLSSKVAIETNETGMCSEV